MVVDREAPYLPVPETNQLEHRDASADVRNVTEKQAVWFDLDHGKTARTSSPPSPAPPTP